MKFCRKQLHEYDKHLTRCPECTKTRQAKWAKDHSEYFKEYSARRYLIKKDHIKAVAKAWKDKNRERHLAGVKAWQAQNTAKDRQNKKAYQARRKAVDSIFKLSVNVRSLIRYSLKSKGYSKKSKSCKILGASINQVQRHLIQTALNNYGFWLETETYHIDHIIPLSTAKSEEEVLKLNNYTNLQLLYPKDNLRKRAKLLWTREELN